MAAKAKDKLSIEPTKPVAPQPAVKCQGCGKTRNRASMRLAGDGRDLCLVECFTADVLVVPASVAATASRRRPLAAVRG